MNQLQKAAAFLILVGFEKGRSIIALMDSREINNIVPEIGKLSELSPEIQKKVWAEFEQLGYEETMNPCETLSTIRLLFNGSCISKKNSGLFN